jgi:hypothetical protein
MESAVARASYQAANKAFAAWLDKHTIAAHGAMILPSELHAAYASHCQQENRTAASKQAFGRTLRSLFRLLRATQQKLAGRGAWVHIGIDFRGLRRGLREDSKQTRD